MALRRPHSSPVEVRIGKSSLYKLGTTKYDFTDPYHVAITLPWPAFFAVFAAAFVAINLAYAILYSAIPGAVLNARDGSLLDAFFFSVETLATVGYGSMAPGSLYGHVVACTETVVGLVFTAVMTGIIFVRFSRPRPNILFAEQAVVARHDGVPTLMLRLAYSRAGVLAGAVARVDLVRVTRSAEGRTFRQSHELRLARARMPIMAMTWTIMHPIDASSPLYGLDAEGLRACEARIIVMLEARDPFLGTDLLEYHAYGFDQILFGMVFRDVVSYGAGRAEADLRKLSEIEPDAHAAAGPEPVLSVK